MKYKFVYKRNNDWSFDELAIIEKTVALINDPGIEDPILMIGQYLAELTGVKFLIIGRTLPESEKVKTVCFLNYGKQLDNMIYSLKGTPCQHALDYEICYYPVGVKQEFPQDTDLTEMNIESYMGTALNDPYGNKIGLVVLLNETPIQNPGFIEHILTIVSPVLEQQLLLTGTPMR